MSDHILDLLGAYVDGELHGGQFRKVEVHLEECPICAEEYQNLQALSVSLRNAPAPDYPAPERVAADVALRLPRTPARPIRQRALEAGWWLAPVGLIVSWIFISTTILVSNVVTTASELGIFSNAFTWLDSGSSAEAHWSGTLGQLGFLAGDSLQLAQTAEAFTRTTVPQVTWQVAIALLYLSWMAIWWARHTRQEPGGAIDSESRPTV